MSTYFEAYQKLQDQQYQSMLIFAIVGLVWAVGWLVIGRVIPERWKSIAKFYVVFLAMLLGGWLLTVVRG